MLLSTYFDAFFNMENSKDLFIVKFPDFCSLPDPISAWYIMFVLEFLEKIKFLFASNFVVDKRSSKATGCLAVLLVASFDGGVKFSYLLGLVLLDFSF